MHNPGSMVSEDGLAGAESRMRAAGHRLTPQRHAILHTFFAERRHLTAAQVHSMLTPGQPDISLVTVYRTLELLLAAGILVRLNLRDGADRYELSAGCARGHHHHILCTRCGAVAEFDDCLVETLTERLSRLTGFDVTDHWMEMWGLCESCRAAGTSSREAEVQR